MRTLNSPVRRVAFCITIANSLVALPLGMHAQGGAGAASAVQGSTSVPITEWKVPFDGSRPRDPYVAPDGRIWFVGQVGNYVAVFDPGSKEFKKYDLAERTLPHTNIVGPDGTVWIAGNVGATIGKLDPKTGLIAYIPMPAGLTDPHTMAFDGKGGIWFTAQNSNKIGHLVIATSQVHVIDVPTARARPYGIVVDENGQPWFDLFGTNQIGTIDPKTMLLKTFALPDERSRPRRIARTSDGAVWYGDYTRGFLGRLDPKTGHVDEWPNPSGARSWPYAMAVDDADRVWYVETGVQPNRMVAFDTKAKKIVYNAPIESAGTGNNTVRHMVFDPKTRQIWYGSDHNFLGMVKVPPKAAM